MLFLFFRVHVRGLFFVKNKDDLRINSPADRRLFWGISLVVCSPVVCSVAICSLDGSAVELVVVME